MVNVLVIKPSSLGDIIHTLPAIRIIKDNFPATKISWIIFDRFRQLAELFEDIDEIILFKRDEWAHVSNFPDLFRFLIGLRHRKFDYVIDFQGLFRSGICTIFANSKKRVGFADAREFSALFYSQRVSVPESIRHAIDKNIHLVNSAFNLSSGYLPPRYKRKPETVEAAANLIKKYKLGEKKHMIAVAPTARWPSKMWPVFFLPT